MLLSWLIRIDLLSKVSKMSFETHEGWIHNVFRTLFMQYASANRIFEAACFNLKW
jgi:hypothetical protein